MEKEHNMISQMMKGMKGITEKNKEKVNKNIDKKF